MTEEEYYELKNIISDYDILISKKTNYKLTRHKANINGELNISGLVLKEKQFPEEYSKIVEILYELENKIIKEIAELKAGVGGINENNN